MFHIHLNRGPLSRRTMLKASGVTLGLPWLEAMMPTRLSAANPAGTAPVIPARLCIIAVDGGVINSTFHPEEEGTSFDLPSALEPLKPFQDKFSVLTGLAHPKGKGTHGPDHYEFLTSEPFPGFSGGSMRYFESADQVAARHLGTDTRFASLQLATLKGGHGQPGISYTGSSPLPPMNTPRELFDKLFAPARGNAEEMKRDFRMRNSILDVVNNHAKALSNKLGTADRNKMDGYLTSVREVEQRIQREEEWSRIPKPKVDNSWLSSEMLEPNIPSLKNGQVVSRDLWNSYMDLMALAFQTDSTRVMTHCISTMYVELESELGFKDEHHALSHQTKNPKQAAKSSKIDQFNVAAFAHLLKRLNEIPEGNGTLLDNTVLLYGSPAGEGGHSPFKLPIIVAGNRDGKLRQGQHVVYPGAEQRRTPLSNLLLTLLQVTGVATESFGDSTKVLPELLV